MIGDFNKQNMSKTENEFDQLFKKHLQEQEIQPEEHNWDKISARLPVNPYLQRIFLTVSSFAAVLLLGLIVSCLYHHFIQSSNQQHTATAFSTEASPKSLNPFAKRHFVMDMPTDGHSREDAIKELLMEEEETAADLWQFVTSEDDLGTHAFNKDIIEKALKPLEQLPIEGLALLPSKASAPKVKSSVAQDSDLRILIPLRVLSQEELDEMVRREGP